MKFTQTLAVAALVGSISAEDKAAAPAKFACTFGKIEKFTDDKCATPDEAANKKAAEGLAAYQKTMDAAYKDLTVACTEVTADKLYTK